MSIRLRTTLAALAVGLVVLSGPFVGIAPANASVYASAIAPVTTDLSSTPDTVEWTITLESDANPNGIGHSVLYSAVVTPAGGTVSFADDDIALAGCDAVVSVVQPDGLSGLAECAAQSYSAAGTHSIVATVMDAVPAPVSSAPLLQVITADDAGTPDPPATDPPATDPPATDPPATDPPSTDPPGTDPPVTEPPATNPPSTDLPTTEPTVPAAQTVSLDVPQSAMFGSTVEATASSSSGLPVSLDVTGGCHATATGSGWTITMSSGSTDCGVAATQAGDADTAPARAEATVHATLAPQEPIVLTIPSTALYGDTVSAEASGGSGTGSLEFDVSGSACNAADALEPIQLVTMTSGSGDCTVTVSRAGDDDYTGSSAQSGITPERRVLSIDAADASLVYGDPAVDAGWSLTGFVPGDDAQSAAITGEAKCAVDGSGHVGVHPIACSGGTLESPDYTFVTGRLGAATIAPRPLLITASSPASVYGSIPPAITASYDGLAGGDAAPDVAPTCSAAVTATSPVGDYRTSCASASDDDYSISYAEGSLAIGAAVLTIRASDASSIYGSGAPSVAPVYDGFVGGDTESSLTTAPTCAADVGPSTPVSPAAGTSRCAGAADADYAISYESGIVAVTPAPLTVTASSQSAVYGSPAPAIQPVYSGFADGEGVSALDTPATCAPATTDLSPVGDYVSSCSGAAGANYTVTDVPGSVTITRATLTVTASDASSGYGSAPPLVVPLYSGFVASEDASVLSALPACSSNTTTTTAARVYPAMATCTGAGAVNYRIMSVDGTVVITPAPLLITPADATSIYGSTPAHPAARYTGLVNDETPHSLTVPARCVANTTPLTPAGTSTTSACSGAVAPNYSVIYAAGVVVVGRAPLSVTASDGTSVYGAPAPLITPTYIGLVNNEAPAVLDLAATCTANTYPTTPVGSYSATSTCSGVASSNYTVAYAPGRVRITPAILTVTATDAASFYGSVPPVISPLYTGFVNGQTDAVLMVPASCGSTVSSATGAGRYPGATTCVSASGADYSIRFIAGTATVIPAPLALSAVGETRPAGTSNGRYTVNGTGFMNGETVAYLAGSLEFTTAASPTSVPGEYPLSARGLRSPDYDITWIDGAVTVTAALPAPDETGAESFGPPTTTSTTTTSVSQGSTTQSTTQGSTTTDSGGDVTETGDGTTTSTTTTTTTESTASGPSASSPTATASGAGSQTTLWLIISTAIVLLGAAAVVWRLARRRRLD